MLFCSVRQTAAILKLAKFGADVTIRNIHDESPFGMCCHSMLLVHLYTLCCCV